MVTINSINTATGASGTILQGQGVAVTPLFTTATYPATTTVSQLLYSSSANVIAGLATANSASLVTNSTGVPVFSGTMTNGQLIIGSTGATPTASTLTAGIGIAITNGAGSISIAVTGAGFTWNDSTGATVTLVAENGYVCDRGGGVTFTLPASGTLGDIIAIVGKLGAWTVAQNANQQILLGDSSSTVGVGGSIASAQVGDCVEIVCITAGASTVWRVRASMGNITIV